MKATVVLVSVLSKAASITKLQLNNPALTFKMFKIGSIFVKTVRGKLGVIQ